MNETLLVSLDRETFHITSGELSPAFCGFKQVELLGVMLSWGMASFCGIIYPSEINNYRGTCFECLVKYKASCT